MKRKSHEEHENHERWLVSYADFITLLFAFFVVLYATSNANTEKEKKFEESIRKEMKLGVGFGAGVGNGAGPKEGFGTKFGEVDAIPDAEIFPRRIGPTEAEDLVERVIQKIMSDKEREEAISSIRHDSLGVRISLSASNFFPSGSAKLRLPALTSLDKLASILKKTDLKVLVEGHTDDQQVNAGQFETNWELASARATSVVRYLAKVHKLDPKRMGAISYGDQRPVAPNTTEANRNLNRRIEIVIITDRNIPL